MNRCKFCNSPIDWVDGKPHENGERHKCGKRAVKYQQYLSNKKMVEDNIRRKIEREDNAIKPDEMQSKWVKCWKCDKWTIGKPVFVKGVKKWKYYNKDKTEHGCSI